MQNTASEQPKADGQARTNNGSNETAGDKSGRQAGSDAKQADNAAQGQATASDGTAKGKAATDSASDAQTARAAAAKASEAASPQAANLGAQSADGADKAANADRSAIKDADLIARLRAANGQKDAAQTGHQSKADVDAQNNKAKAQAAAAGKAASDQSAEKAAKAASQSGQRVSVSVQNSTPVVRPNGPINGATAVAAADAAQQAQQKTSDAAAKAATDFLGNGDPKASAEEVAEAKRQRRSAEMSDLRTRADGKSAKADGTSQAGQTRADTPGSQQLRSAVDALNAASRGNENAQPRNDGTFNATLTQTSASTTQAQSQTFDPVMQQHGLNNAGTSQSTAVDAAGKAQAANQARSMPFQPPVDQVAVQIQRAAANGQRNMQIRLNPAELGRIEVKLEMRDDGLVRAVMSVDKPETLDLMQRDPRALEKALNDAGLKTDSGSLSFNLRGEGDGGNTHGGDGQNSPSSAGILAGNEIATDDPSPMIDETRSGLGNDRLDIRV